MAQSSGASPVDPPAGAHLLMTAQGQGLQIYICTDRQWVLQAPDAKLFNAQGTQIGTHFAGPTWLLNDGSQVKGKVLATQASPDSKAVPWLLLEAVPNSGSGQFASVAWITRTNTQGGKAPAVVCPGPGAKLPVAYTATYSFYTR
ncbi:DUF3455 domain-containing protein [Silvibacterium dinghuense]|nr:DUF3455 domain-containing protein [Silvibacterium dinghuense]